MDTKPVGMSVVLKQSNLANILIGVTLGLVIKHMVDLDHVVADLRNKVEKESKEDLDI